MSKLNARGNTCTFTQISPIVHAHLLSCYIITTPQGNLIEDLPRLVDARVPYLDPSFEALVKCQLRFAATAHEKLAALHTEFQQGLKAGHGDGASVSLEGRVEAVLQQLRDLSITGAPTSA